MRKLKLLLALHLFTQVIYGAVPYPIPPVYGGTGRTTLTTGSLLVGNGTSAVTLPSGLTWDSALPTLRVTNPNASTTLTNFTQSLTKAGLNVISTYSDGAYFPGVFWSASNNNVALPKAGIWIKNDTTAGSTMYLGVTPFSGFTTGITVNALQLAATEAMVGDTTAYTLRVGGATGYTFTSDVTNTTLRSSAPILVGNGSSTAGRLDFSYGANGVAIRDATGSVRYPIVTSAEPASSASLKIIRGKISSTGTLLLGEGFTASRPINPGAFQANFGTSFSATPVCVCSNFGGGTASWCIPSAGFTDATQARFNVLGSDGNLQNQDVGFICIGPR